MRPHLVFNLTEPESPPLARGPLAETDGKSRQIPKIIRSKAETILRGLPLLPLWLLGGPDSPELD